MKLEDSFIETIDARDEDILYKLLYHSVDRLKALTREPAYIPDGLTQHDGAGCKAVRVTVIIEGVEV